MQIKMLIKNNTGEMIQKEEKNKGVKRKR